MIQSFREKLSGVLAIGIIVLIAIPLAFFGVESLFLSGNRIANVGSVNGQDISELQFERQIINRQNQIAQLLGENYSPDLVDSSLIQSQAINDLINRGLYLTHAESEGMGVSEGFIGTQIRNSAQFQLGGQFSEGLFRSFLTQMGYTSATFMETFHDDIVSQQLIVGLQTSAFATETTLGSSLAISQEKRSYQTLLLSVDSVLDDVVVSDEEIAEFYAANNDLFMLPERISLNYVELQVSDFTDQVDVSDAEIQARMQLEQASLPVRREAAHILVETQADDSHFSVLDEIQVKLEEGVDFADLAAEYSADTGSSSNGGSLGYSDGTSFPEEFEAALSELDLNEVSGPVMTDFGFHIVKLVGIDRTELVLEDERERIDASLRIEKAGDIYRQNIELLRDTAFSNDTLSELVADFSDVVTLEIYGTDLFDRQSGSGIAANEIVRAAAFSESFLSDELNSDVLEVTGTSAVVVNLNERVSAGVAPLEDVSAQIESRLRTEKGTGLLEETAIAIQGRLESGEEAEDIARDEDIEWQVQLDAVRGSGGEIGEAIFSASVAQGLPLAGSSVLSNGDYMIYIVDEVSPGSIDDFNELQISQLAAQLSQSMSNSEAIAYTNRLKADAKIDMKIAFDE